MSVSVRIYLEVPFPERKAARILGAQWDQTAKAWFIPVGIDPAPLLNCWPRLEGDPARHRPESVDADGQSIAAKVLGRRGGLAGGRKGGLARARVSHLQSAVKEISMQGVMAKKAARLSRLEIELQPLSRYGSELRAGRRSRSPGSDVAERPRQPPHPLRVRTQDGLKLKPNVITKSRPSPAARR